MVESYAKTASQIKKMNHIEFFTKYGEASRILKHVSENPNEAAQQILSLHRRHAGQVCSVLHDAATKHSAGVLSKQLPETCLVNMILAEEVKYSRESNKPVFRKDGDRWTLCFEGKTVYANHVVGMDYIQYLLKHPWRKFPIKLLDLELWGTIPPEKASPHSKTREEKLEKEGLSIGYDDTYDTSIDQQTLKECKTKIADLEDELEEAEKNDDIQKVADIKYELDQYKSYLSGSLGVDGKPRKVKTTSERARKKISNAVKRANDKIKKIHPPLWNHLNRSISTGDYIVYNPDPVPPWDFGAPKIISKAATK